VILFQRMMYRADLRMNPNVLYLMGENETYRGAGGQAAEMRGEPNMRPIRTKYVCIFLTSDSIQLSEICITVARARGIRVQQSVMIDEDFIVVSKAMESGSIIVCPLDMTGTRRGLGTGMSQQARISDRTRPVHDGRPALYEVEGI